MTHRSLAYAVAVLAAGFAAPAFAQKAKDTLRFPVTDPDAGIDTYILPSSFANVYGPTVTDMLVGFDPKKGQFVGHLAKSFTQPNPTTYEFELRTDIKWHDGQAFDADDVVHTFNYLIDPKVTLRYKAYWAWVDKVEKVGTHKVRLTAKRPVPDGLMYLASRTPIYPEHVHAPLANKLDYASKPIGTGPMRIVQMDQNRGIIGERYADYVPSSVKPPSGIGKFVSEPIKDMGTLTAALLTGQADLAADLPPDQAEDLVKSGRFEFTLAPPNVGYTFIGFPAKGWESQKALADVRVRTAIVKAMDRHALIKVKFGALAEGIEPDEALCSKEQLGCGYTKLAPEHDPAGAKKLLAEAGYADGFDVTISCFPNSASEATALAGMLRAVGIRATVRQHPTAQRVQLINQGRVEIGYYGWSGGSMFDVSGQLGRHVDSKDYGDPELAKLAAPTYSIMDDAERRKAIAKVFDHIAANAYGFPTTPNRPVFTHTKEVKLNAPGIRADQVSPHEFGWK
jgi:peptide/nickel transport system substrate-binding protein